eukprot:scaffold60189_cov33-Tisochrysis_lutea.AAC.1
MSHTCSSATCVPSRSRATRLNGRVVSREERHASRRRLLSARTSARRPRAFARRRCCRRPLSQQRRTKTSAMAPFSSSPCAAALHTVGVCSHTASRSCPCPTGSASTGSKSRGHHPKRRELRDARLRQRRQKGPLHTLPFLPIESRVPSGAESVVPSRLQPGEQGRPPGGSRRSGPERTRSPSCAVSSSTGSDEPIA